MRAPTERDAADAARAVGAFWAALANDDDLALLRVINQANRDAGGSGAGLCDRFRQKLQVSPDQCRTVGISSKVRVPPSGLMVFMCMSLGPGASKVVGMWGSEQIEA